MDFPKPTQGKKHLDVGFSQEVKAYLNWKQSYVGSVSSTMFHFCVVEKLTPLLLKTQKSTPCTCKDRHRERIPIPFWSHCHHLKVFITLHFNGEICDTLATGFILSLTRIFNYGLSSHQPSASVPLITGSLLPV